MFSLVSSLVSGCFSKPSLFGSSPMISMIARLANVEDTGYAYILKSALKEAAERVKNSGIDLDGDKLRAIQEQVDIMLSSGVGWDDIKDLVEDIQTIAKDAPLDIDTF